jgi:hypothetical protein
MSIYLEMLEKVENGERFYINFEKRAMKVGGKVIIDNGEYDTSKKLYDGEIYSLDALLSEIKALYKKYKYSLPSERSDNKRRKYFKALSVDELTDEQLIIGQPREVAQFALEAFILCTILNGDFVWDEETMGKWFYEHPSDPDLVILKSWIEGK